MCIEAYIFDFIFFWIKSQRWYCFHEYKLYVFILIVVNCGFRRQKDVFISKGESSIFLAEEGDRSCIVRYRVSSSLIINTKFTHDHIDQLHLNCLKMKLTCQPTRRFYIDCHRGDRFVIRTQTAKRYVLKGIVLFSYISICRFCFHKKPVGPKFGSKVGPIYSSSNIKIWFQSPSRTSRARCLVQCVEGTSNGNVIHQIWIFNVNTFGILVYLQNGRF